MGRFAQPDTIIPPGQGVQAFDRYSYVNNSPINYTDTSGHWLETLWDIGSVILDVVDIAQNGLSWENSAALAIDIVSVVLPAVPAVGSVIMNAGRAANTVDNALDATRAADDIADAARAIEGMQTAGQWVSRNEHMSDASRAYQRFISGRADDLVYEVGGYTFDGFDASLGILKDAKDIPANFVDVATNEFKPWVSGTSDWLKQAENQVSAAGGIQINWFFSSQAARDAMYNLFLANNPDILNSIELIFKPLK